jgi:negative regulator of flagellin synthesis FlgM
MRITDTQNRAAEQVATARTGIAQGARKGAPPPPPPPVNTAGAVKVSVSDEAKALAESAQASNASSDIDTAKVERLKSAVDNGSFKVDAGAIADKIVNEGE